MKKGKTGVSTSAIEVSPARARRDAKKRRAEEKAWREKNGPVQTVRLPTPIGSARERECVGNPYQGMRSGECAAEPTTVIGGELPAGFVLAGVCDGHLSSVLEAFREYGRSEPTMQSVEQFRADLQREDVPPEFRDAVGGAW